MDNLTLPNELISVIDSEKIEFSLLAKRNQPGKKSVGLILFGAVWTAFTSIFVIVFFGPLFRGKESHFETNGVPTTGSWENFGPMIVPALIIGFFVIIGIGLLFAGFYALFQKGGYFVATKTRLIKYYKGKINSYAWEQFSGNMEIDHVKGDIVLQLKTGKMISRENSSDRFVPDMLYISGASDVMDIEKICRQRIKENDTTTDNKLQTNLYSTG